MSTDYPKAHTMVLHSNVAQSHTVYIINAHTLNMISLNIVHWLVVKLDIRVSLIFSSQSHLLKYSLRALITGLCKYRASFCCFIMNCSYRTFTMPLYCASQAL